MTARSARLFVRDATGLVRAYGLLDATLININAIVPISFFTFAIGAGLYAFPGADLAITLVLATILTVFWGICYGLFASIMPRSGSEYVYLSRIHPAIGFGESFAFSVIRASFACGGAIFAGLTFGLSSFADVYGRMTGNSAMVMLGQQVTHGHTAFAVGLIMLIVIWRPPRSHRGPSG